MLLEWVYYLVTIASLLQAATYLFVWWRTRQRAALWLGMPTFLLIAAGAAMTQISIGDNPIVPRADLVVFIRLCYLVASLLWIAEQALYVRRFLRIVHR